MAEPNKRKKNGEDDKNLYTGEPRPGQNVRMQKFQEYQGGKVSDRSRMRKIVENADSGKKASKRFADNVRDGFDIATDTAAKSTREIQRKNDRRDIPESRRVIEEAFRKRKKEW